LSNDEIKYLVFDVESVPDAKLIKKVKYAGLDIDEKTAVKKFQEEVLTKSDGASYFIPVTFQYPVAICVAKVKEDFSLSDIVSLDAPKFNTRDMVKLFWQGIEREYKEAALVTFNGRGFDIPLLELMAFRYGFIIKRHMKDKFGTRFRFGAKHLDLHDWLSNYSAIKMQGGLNLLAKILGKPGKMETTGEEVYDLFLDGKIQAINDYCIHDVLDTYFVFLRTRVLMGELTIEKEIDLVKATKNFITDRCDKVPAFAYYLKNWGDWALWP
jgi:3'-5' exonuclease